MTDPKRLLETDAGRARELLQVGLSDAAPLRVRSKVLSAVSGVVAELDLGALHGPGTSLSHEPSGAEGLGGNTVTAPTGLSAASQSGALTKLVSVAQSAAALKLGAVVAALMPKLGAIVAALGLGGLVYHQVQQRAAAPAAVQTVARPHALAPIEPPASPVVASAPEVVAAPALPPVAEAPATTTPTTHPRGASRSSAALPRKTASRSSPEPAQGTLGAELSLLGRVRQRIEAGDLERAVELLDEYERQFPRGALQPEAAVLRQRSQAQTR
jgi:hypothetical protein